MLQSTKQVDVRSNKEGKGRQADSDGKVERSETANTNSTSASAWDNKIKNSSVQSQLSKIGHHN